MITPDKDGIELIVELKRLSPEVKILAISGQGMRGLDSGRSGAEMYLEIARELGEPMAH